MFHLMDKEKVETRPHYQRGTQRNLSDEEVSVLWGMHLLKTQDERKAFLAAVRKSVRDKLIALRLV